MNAVHNDSRTPLYQRLNDPLAQQIANIQGRSGEAIPRETPLSAEYLLSTCIVRKAVDARVNAGLLERQQGRRTLVRRPLRLPDIKGLNLGTARARAPIRFTPKLPDSIGIAAGYDVFAFLIRPVACGCSHA
ncbi:regulatory protein, gntR family [Pseudomonas syringae]|jgi:DNA-binding FadR family transcriptional regulator|uniref:GntR family transcriptional regulator n=1 Tax=Pseudomonas syringae TaxID=317 RepID=UPI0008E8F043|nr:regulatory protein, gntR family [Pseudomonas syringae]